MLQTVKEERNVAHSIRRRKASSIGHFLRRSSILNLIIEGKIEVRIEVNRRRGRRPKWLLDDRNETRGFWKLKEEALDRSVWRTCFGRGYWPVVRQNTE